MTEDPSALLVTEMADGGMGSLLFAGGPERRFGGAAATAWFRDADGMDVLAALSLDQHGRVFELDIWRCDFAPLRRIPPPGELGPPPG